MRTRRRSYKLNDAMPNKTMQSSLNLRRRSTFVAPTNNKNVKKRKQLTNMDESLDRNRSDQTEIISPIAKRKRNDDQAGRQNVKETVVFIQKNDMKLKEDAKESSDNSTRKHLTRMKRSFSKS